MQDKEPTTAELLQRVKHFEDARLAKLVEILAKRKLISAEDVKTILSLQPFPQLYA